MKRKFELLKTVQLALLVVLAVIGLVIIFTDKQLYQMVGSNPSVRSLCVLLWVLLLLSFGFVFWDFSTHAALKRDYRELDYAVHTDAVSGIANRFSCDAMIDKYADKPLPPTVGCVMLEITNLDQINQVYGRRQGNSSIQDFSDILHEASIGLCFVGRNGGNKFMALFEDCTETKIGVFLTKVGQKIELYNLQSSTPNLECSCGRAFDEGPSVTSITQLIALADKRGTARTDSTGIASRAVLDDVIAGYLDKPLPEDMGVTVVTLVNLPVINAQFGHLAGNRALQEFSDAVRESARGICCAGRNSGLTYLAVFEHGTQEDIDTFASRLAKLTKAHNETPDALPFEYTIGTAFHESASVPGLPELITLAAHRAVKA